MITPQQRQQILQLSNKIYCITFEELEKHCPRISVSSNCSFVIHELAKELYICIKFNPLAKGKFHLPADFDMPCIIYIGLDVYSLHTVRNHFPKSNITIRGNNRTKSSREAKINSGFSIEQVLTFANTYLDKFASFF